MRQLTKPKHPKIQIGKLFERTFKSVNVPQEFILQSPLQQFKSALESDLILLILRQSFNFKLSSSSSSTFHLDYMNRCTQTCVLESCNLSLRKPTSPQGTQPLTAASSRNRAIRFPCKGMEIWPRQSEFHARNAWKSDRVHGILTNKRKQQFLNFHLLPRNQF